MNPEMEGPMDGRCKELQRYSQAGAQGYGSKHTRVARGFHEGVIATVRQWTIRDGRAKGCLVLDP